MGELREIQLGKFSMMFYSGGVTDSCRFLNFREKAEVNFKAINSYLGHPFPGSLVPTDTYKSRSIGAHNSFVVLILRFSALAEIFSPIVQRLMIPVISFFFVFAAKNNAMHKEKLLLFPATGIESSTSWIPNGIPKPLREPPKINRVNDRNLVSSQRDKAVGCVERLSDRVRFHAARINSFWHRSSEKGLLQPAAILTWAR